MSPGATSVLIVDDSEGVRAAVSMLLEDGGFNAFSAASFSEAVGCILHGEYDLILIDVQLGVESGLLLAAQVLERRPNAKIILMSGADLPVHSAVEIPVLKKPFSRAELLDCIAKVIDLAA